MSPKLITAVAALREAARRFALGQLSSFDYRYQREMALAAALRAMAADNQVTLQEPLQVDSNGEFMIVALGTDGRSPHHGCGQFGGDFARALTENKARTGFPGPNQIAGEQGWCRLNHFAAERMVNAYYDQRTIR